MSNLFVASQTITYQSETLKMIIVDDDKAFVNQLVHHLKSDRRIDILGVAHDGHEALQLLKQHKPDIIILDLIMPKLDGFGLMQQALRLDLLKDTKIIVMSEATDEKVVSYAMRLGAHYFMFKPFELDVMSERIELLMGDIEALIPQTPANTLIEARIIKNLIDSGLPVHTLGYRYFLLAIQHLLIKQEEVYSITKNVYPYVAKVFKTSSANVDKALRHAITLAYTQNPYSLSDFLNEMNFKDSTKKPSNSEFIGLMLQKIKQEVLNDHISH